MDESYPLAFVLHCPQFRSQRPAVISTECTWIVDESLAIRHTKDITTLKCQEFFNLQFFVINSHLLSIK